MRAKKEIIPVSGSLVDRSGNDPSNRDSRISSEIEVGKGKVEVGNEVMKAVEGKYLVLELSEEKSPCPDNLCQPMADIDIKLLDNIGDHTYEIISSEKFTLAISKAVFRSIDKGREHTTIRKGKFGNLNVKGFSLTA